MIFFSHNKQKKNDKVAIPFYFFVVRFLGTILHFWFFGWGKAENSTFVLSDCGRKKKVD